ncbi:MAG: ORF6N domain-containing protein [Leptospirales bacterium]
MNTNKNQEIVYFENITSQIHFIRGQKVLLDADIAKLYAVETKILNQAVKRNLERFPIDFMFQLNDQELDNLRSQFVTSSYGGRRYLPYAFTEQGIAMLSSVLNNPRAIKVNIEIMRAFIKLRQYLVDYEELKSKLQEVETKSDEQFSIVFEVIEQLLNTEKHPRRKIGF